jgi:hypothetical protein
LAIMALIWVAASWVSASTILLTLAWLLSLPTALSSLGLLVLAYSLDFGLASRTYQLHQL